MKRFFFLLLAVTGMIYLSAACNEVSKVDAVEEYGALELVIDQGAPATKALSTASEGYETLVKSLDLYVFEGGTTLYFHERINPAATTTDATRLEWSVNAQNKISCTVKRLPATTYTLMLVANAPESVLAGKTTPAAVKGAEITLGNCSLSDGFVMFAEATNIPVTGGETYTLPSEVKLERFASRVRLVSVTNGIPSSAAYANNNSVTVNGVFLSNVASVWNLGGAGDASMATNVRGKQSNANITPSTEVTYPVTLSSSTQPVTSGSSVNLGWKTYGFPTQAVLTGATEPKLVICATVNGTMYYYPVFLLQGAPYEARGGIGRNMTYDISVTISGTGNTDPDARLLRGAIAATVSIKDWDGGSEYPENF